MQLCKVYTFYTVALNPLEIIITIVFSDLQTVSEFGTVIALIKA